MFILNTNVISEIIRPTPVEQVFDWVARQQPEELFLTVVTEAELRYGAAVLPGGHRRERLLIQIDAMLEWDFAGRILPFDSKAAQAYTVIASEHRTAGLPISLADCQIASIALTIGAKIVSRDVSGFRDCGVELINPWLVLDEGN